MITHTHTHTHMLQYRARSPSMRDVQNPLVGAKPRAVSTLRPYDDAWSEQRDSTQVSSALPNILSGSGRMIKYVSQCSMQPFNIVTSEMECIVCAELVRFLKVYLRHQTISSSCIAPVPKCKPACCHCHSLLFSLPTVVLKTMQR